MKNVLKGSHICLLLFTGRVGNRAISRRFSDSTVAMNIYNKQFTKGKRKRKEYIE